jgi:hypothetical protein
MKAHLRIFICLLRLTYSRLGPPAGARPSDFKDGNGVIWLQAITGVTSIDSHGRFSAL